MPLSSDAPPSPGRMTSATRPRYASGFFNVAWDNFKILCLLFVYTTQIIQPNRKHIIYCNDTRKISLTLLDYDIYFILLFYIVWYLKLDSRHYLVFKPQNSIAKHKHIIKKRLRNERYFHIGYNLRLYTYIIHNNVWKVAQNCKMYTKHLDFKILLSHSSFLADYSKNLYCVFFLITNQNHRSENYNIGIYKIHSSFLFDPPERYNFAFFGVSEN